MQATLQCALGSCSKSASRRTLRTWLAAFGTAQRTTVSSSMSGEAASTPAGCLRPLANHCMMYGSSVAARSGASVVCVPLPHSLLPASVSQAIRTATTELKTANDLIPDPESRKRKPPTLEEVNRYHELVRLASIKVFLFERAMQAALRELRDQVPASHRAALCALCVRDANSRPWNSALLLSPALATALSPPPSLPPSPPPSPTQHLSGRTTAKNLWVRPKLPGADT